MTRQEEIERVHGNGTHLVILGAGASIASTIRNPEKNGKKLPSMNNIVEVVGLQTIVNKLPSEIKNQQEDFEKLYSLLCKEPKLLTQKTEIEIMVYNYFKSLKISNEPTIYDYLIFSLRPYKDVIATFNWDPFLFQAYNRISKFTQPCGILHLHGNVSLGYCERNDSSGPSGMYSKATNDYCVYNNKKLYHLIIEKYTTQK